MEFHFFREIPLRFGLQCRHTIPHAFDFLISPPEANERFPPTIDTLSPYRFNLHVFDLVSRYCARQYSLNVVYFPTVRLHSYRNMLNSNFVLSVHAMYSHKLVIAQYALYALYDYYCRCRCRFKRNKYIK